MNETKSGGMTAQQYFNAHKGISLHAFDGLCGVLVGWRESPMGLDRLILRSPLYDKGWVTPDQFDHIDETLSDGLKLVRYLYIPLDEEMLRGGRGGNHA